MAEKDNRYNASEKGKKNRREFMRGYMIEWRKRRRELPDYDPEEERRKWREQHKKVREKAMEKLGGKLCANCRCNDFSILEINHINGGGRKALKRTQNRQLYWQIVNDKVDLNEYNVLCRVCNALHYVQDILGIEGHTVSWRSRIMVVQRS